MTNQNDLSTFTPLFNSENVCSQLASLPATKAAENTAATLKQRLERIISERWNSMMVGCIHNTEVTSLLSEIVCYWTQECRNVCRLTARMLLCCQQLNKEWWR